MRSCLRIRFPGFGGLWACLERTRTHKEEVRRPNVHTQHRLANNRQGLIVCSPCFPMNTATFSRDLLYNNCTARSNPPFLPLGVQSFRSYFRNALRKTFGSPNTNHTGATSWGTRLLSPRWRRGATRQSHRKHSCRQAFCSFTQPRVNRRVLIRVRPRLQAAGLPASQPSGQPACVQLLLLLLVARVALSAAAAHGLRTCQEGRCTSLLSSSRRLSPFRTYSKAG